jgi:hypothetical protein
VHDGKTISWQQAGDVLYKDTVDIALKRTGPPVKFREFELILAGACHYLRPVEIVRYANGTYRNDLALIEGYIACDRSFVLPRV